MRRGVLIVLSCGVLAGCGAQGVVSPTPVTIVGKAPAAPQAAITPAFKLTGDPAAGAKVFASAGCSGCHTLAAAHATGTVGPNLDQLKPPYDKVVTQVTNGGAVMPSFKGQLTPQQINDIAAYVSSVAGK